MKKVALGVLTLLVLAAIWWWGDGGGAPRAPLAAVVNVVIPRSSMLVTEIEAVGSTRARAAIDVATPVAGRLERILFEEGQEVRKGDLLASLDDRAARADLAGALARQADAQAGWRRAQQLAPGGMLSQAEADALEAALKAANAAVDAARVELADHEIRAAFDGVVGLRRVDAGSYLKVGDIITTLDDVEQLEVAFSIPERYLREVRPGQRVELVSASYSERRFHGEVARLDTRVDPLTRTVSVKALLENEMRELRPGQFLNVRLRSTAREALMIPEAAILTEGGSSFAYVVTAEDKAERRELLTGQRRQGWVEVRDGISAAEQVVVNGNDRLATGMPVEVRDDPEALLPQIRDVQFQPEEG